MHAHEVTSEAAPARRPASRSAAPTGMLGLQQQAGNRAVASAVQRFPEGMGFEEAGPSTWGNENQSSDPQTNEPGGSEADGGNQDMYDPNAGGPHVINAPLINLNAPMVTAPGVLQVDTIVANNVVASNYTPGAGNVW